MPKRKSRRRRPQPRLSRRQRGLLATIALLVLAQLLFTFVPYASVPEQLRPLYLELLAFRNKAVRRSGLPLELYPASARVDAAGGDIRVSFAPSPSIVRELTGFVAGARTTVDVCVFDLDLEPVADALIDAAERQVKVRVITDTDNAELPAIQHLQEHGIACFSDHRSAFMHNKFVVVDQQLVWTGSFNFTGNGAKRNDNNALIIGSPLLALNYAAEFEEMWFGQFGPASPRATPNPRILIGETEIRNYFAPEDEVMDEVIDTVKDAERSIRIMAFAFTEDALIKALRKRCRRGVQVACLLDAGQAGELETRFAELIAAGAVFRRSRNHRGVMHHKVIIIDDRTVITGSFNFSRNADRQNDENVVIVTSPALAAVYNDEFHRCWTGIKGY